MPQLLVNLEGIREGIRKRRKKELSSLFYILQRLGPWLTKNVQPSF